MTLRDKRQKKHKIRGGQPSSLRKSGFSPIKDSSLGNQYTTESETVYGFPPEVGYDDIIRGYNIKLKDCSHRNECLKWILVGVYNANVEPQFKNLHETLERAKINKELSDLEYNTKKNYLTGRHMENKNVLVNIINKNNFDSLPIPKELQNPNGNVRTEIDPEKIIDTNNKWIQAYEECLYLYTKLATNEFYDSYDCKIEYPIFKKKKKIIKNKKSCPINWDSYKQDQEVKPLIDNPKTRKQIEDYLVKICDPSKVAMTVKAAARELKLLKPL